MAIVHVKNKRNGITYVYESTNYWDKEKKQSRSKRVCIGKLDGAGNMIPSKRLNEQEALACSMKRGPVPVAETARSFYGATYLFGAIGDKLGITEDLKQCFPNTYKQILSVAYYLILEDSNPLSRFEKWGSIHKHPFGKDIPSQRSSELFASITEESKDKFFRCQGKRRIESEYWAYDTTTISSYSTALKQVQYGKNKEDDRLPQLNLALVFGEKSSLPFYYRNLAGNIPDSKTVKTLIEDLDVLGFHKVKLVMDRGFYSEANINGLYKEHLKFLIATKTSLSFIKKELDAVYDDSSMFSNYDNNLGVYSMTVASEWNYTQERPYKKDTMEDKRRIYIHLYYNIDKAAEDAKKFDSMLSELQKELLSEKRVERHESQYKKYFEVKTTPKRGIQVTAKADAIKAAKRYYGYFVLLSNEKMDSVTALYIYRNKDVVEKAFGNLKDRLSMRRMLVSSEKSLNGKLFVEFIALIYLSYINKQMKEQKLYETYTMQEALDKLDVIECFEHPGQELRVGELLEKQKKLYIDMGVDPPTSL
jgi:transposase